MKIYFFNLLFWTHFFSFFSIHAQSFPNKEARMDSWQQARFGMFVHWGPIAQKGTEISWSRGREVPVDIYDNLYKSFDPAKFNADEWVSLAKAAGMKYIVLTAKHHDGFCMWDTKQTTYNIMNTPFKRDVVKELAQACKKQGLAFGAYYSTCDWFHPDFPKTGQGGKTTRDQSNIDAYTAYLKLQVAELIHNYGPLSTIWFDVPQCFDSTRGQGVIDYMRSIQPDILINDRTGAKGDYETPEQRVGKMKLDRPWETCMTIGKQWAWRPNEETKDLGCCLRGLILSAAGNGNFLFNIGPSPQGTLEPSQKQRLLEMGEWLKQNGDAIYGTQGGPYLPGRTIASTRKNNCVFVHVLDWKKEVVSLPALPSKIKKASLLNGVKVNYRIANGRIYFTVPTEHRDTISTIVRFSLEASADKIPLIDAMDDFTAFASNVKNNNPRYDAGMLVDGSKDPLSRWATDDTVRQAWIEIDLKRPRTFDALVINESEYSQIKRFNLSYKMNGTWHPFFDGTSIGEELQVRFKTLTAQKIKLEILESETPPALTEVDIREVK